MNNKEKIEKAIGYLSTVLHAREKCPLGTILHSTPSTGRVAYIVKLLRICVFIENESCL